MLDAAVLAVGGGAHESHGLLARVLRVRHPGRYGEELVAGAIGPVRLGFLQRRPQALHRLHLSLGAGEIAASRHAEAAREASQGVGLSLPGRGSRQRRRAGPVAALERIARRDRRHGREPRQGAEVLLGERGDLVDQRLGLHVLRELEMRIHHEIRRMVVVGLDLDGRSVRRDRVFPHSDHRVDVRGHVSGVRRRRRDLRVHRRDLDALVGERRIVVGVDEIVRHARVLRVLLEQALQDLRRLQLVRVGLVALGGRGL